MDRFETQFEDLDVATGYYENATSNTTATATPQEDVDKLMGQVADEAGVELSQEMAGPNVITPLPILLTLNAADAVLVLGSLGFLGLGVPANVPEWGSDLNLALAAIPTGIWWTALFPGLAMFFLVLGLSFIGEELENIFEN